MKKLSERRLLVSEIKTKSSRIERQAVPRDYFEITTRRATAGSEQERFLLKPLGVITALEIIALLFR